jgi:hypothetical protein
MVMGLIILIHQLKNYLFSGPSRVALATLAVRLSGYKL